MPFTITRGLVAPFTISLTSPVTAIVSFTETNPSRGMFIRTIGATISRVTSMESVPVLPLALTATATIIFVPSRNGTVAENPAPEIAAGTPLIFTPVTPLPIVPVTGMVSLFVIRPSAGLVTAISTGVVSTVN